MPDEPTIEETLSSEDEAALVATVPPRVLLRALRAKEGVAEKLLAGFRAGADSLKLPPVRARLLRESALNPELRETILDAWRDGNSDLLAAITHLKPSELAAALPVLAQQWGGERVRLALRLDPREDVRAMPLPEAGEAAPTPPPKPPAPKAPPSRDAGDAARLRDEVHALKEDLARARKEMAKAHAQLEQAERWEGAARSALGDVADLRRALERSARQVEREQKARGELDARAREALRAHRQAAAELEALRRHVEEEQQARIAREACFPPADAWLEAAHSLLGSGQAGAAVAFLAPLARDYPDADAVREVLAEAYQALGAPAMAVTEWCALARKQLRQGDAAEAVLLAGRALACSPDDRAARACVAEMARAAGGRDLPRAAIRRVEAMAKRSPELRGLLEPILGGAGPPVEPALTLDTPVEWPQELGAFTMPLRTVLAAMDANQVDTVTRARGGLRRLHAGRPGMHAALLKLIRDHDETYRTPLVRKTRPVVVDGSNVAWQACDEAGRPRLENLLRMRRELRGLGYFPIRVYVDASLIYQIDRRAELEALIARSEIRMTDAGRDGDEQILEDARDTGSPVVTNDRMAEHDPEGVVSKIRFEAAPDGVAIRRWHEHQ